ncbi:hypothetical protein DPV78_006381 [Talaromyces pinophilus]|nr:hypothetical protein DPV78_006381 [Talaromyces pinophilus]
MESEKNLQINCAEDISLLSLLHSIPEKPTSNQLNFQPNSRSQIYTLPFDKERSFTGILAFIASIRDDYKHIPAVCVGESCDSSHLKIFLAVNKAGTDDGNSILNDMKRGLDQIFGLLESGFASGRNPRDVEHEVFTQVVSMCSSRIRTRLGLSSGKRGNRRSINDNLLQVVRYVKKLDNHQIEGLGLTTVVGSFLQAAKETISLVNAWSNHQTLTELERLVDGIYRFHRQQSIATALRLVSDKDINPSLKTSLLNMTSKVARYREAAAIIFRVARKFPIVRQARVESICFPQESFQCPAIGNYKPNLLSAISRVVPKYHTTKIGQIWKVLQMTESGAASRFAEQAQNTLQQARIHAEIQLIFHCELHLDVKFPRVIGSSKDACFLCDAFISLHGKTYTPRCHGRLYPLWRLPYNPQLMNLQRSLNRYLESACKESFGALISTRKRIAYPCPLESTLLTLPTSVSAKESLHSSLSSMKAIPLGDSLGGDSSSISETDEGYPCRFVKPEVDQPARITENPPAKNVSWSDNHLPTKSWPDYDESSTYQTLISGATLTKRMKDVSSLYAAGSLEVQIEHDRQPVLRSEDVIFTIEWLSIEDVPTLGESCHLGCIVQAESLERDITLELCQEKTIYIAGGSSLVKVKFH